MKATGMCSKCHHDRLLYVTQVADRSGDAGNFPLDRGTESVAEDGQFYPWRIARVQSSPPGGFAPSTTAAAGLVEAFICRACGFTELYTRDPDQIEVDGVLVREHVGPPRQGPYR